VIDPLELLGRQTPVFTIGAETRSLHLARIHASLIAPVAAAEASIFASGSLRARFRLFDWRPRLTAAAVAFIVAIPSAAVATERTQPDTWLYPVKLAVEPIWRLMDDEIVAQHRIEELRVALGQNQPVETLLARADTAVAQLDPDSIWRRELAAIEQSLKDQAGGAEAEPNSEADAPTDAADVDDDSDLDSSNAVQKKPAESDDEPAGSAEVTDLDEPESDSEERDDKSHESDDDEADDSDDDHESDS